MLIINVFFSFSFSYAFSPGYNGVKLSSFVEPAKKALELFSGITPSYTFFFFFPMLLGIIGTSLRVPLIDDPAVAQSQLLPA